MHDANTSADAAAPTETNLGFGWRVYALGVMAIAVLALMWDAFDPSQPLPKGFAYRGELAYLAGGFMLAAGAATLWRRTVAWGSGALAAYFGLVVFLLMNGRVILAHPGVYGAYSGAAEPLAVAAGGLIVFARTAAIDPALSTRLVRAGQLTFAVCAVLFGGAHFIYMNFTAPLVPKWLPLSGVFWGYATGVFHIAGGLAILAGVRARLAAILLTVMYALFTPLVHIPTVLANPALHFNWTENAANLVLVGVAWVVADSLARAKAAPAP